MAGQHLVLYDGVCGLCNGLVRFVLRRDETRIFDFASLQSATGRSWLQHFGKNADDLDAVIVITDYRGSASPPAMLSKARAAFFIARSIGQPWRAATVLGALPERFLNHAYDFIARRRYRMFGRSEVCVLPTADERHRIIDV